jgi:hypothetical protein
VNTSANCEASQYVIIFILGYFLLLELNFSHVHAVLNTLNLCSFLKATNDTHISLQENYYVYILILRTLGY